MLSVSLPLTVSVLLTWIAIGALAFGVGALFLKTLVPAEETWANAFLAVLCGLALVYAGLLVWHFAFPVNERALAVFIAVGAVGLVLQRRWVGALWRGPFSKLHVVPLVILAVWAANHALMRGGWDDYVYEYQAVRWFHDYPIIPGLGNLHGRLGFNSAHHLYAALLNAGPWTGAVNIVVNGPFVFLAMILAWTACVELLRGRVSERTVFAAVFLAPLAARHILLAELSQPMVSTLKADVAAAALAIITACLWLEFTERTTPGPRRQALAVTIVLTTATLISLRLGSVAFAGVLMVAAFGWLASRRAWRVAMPVTIIVIIVVGAVALRGIVLTGYPFYPSLIFAADVDWQVPVAQAEVERTFILTHAQGRPTIDLHPPGGSWFLPWLRATLLTNRLALVVPAAIALALAPLLFRKRMEHTSATPMSGWIILWAATIGTLGIWFSNAPSARFAWAYWWILFASLVAKSVGRSAPRAALAWPLAVLTLGGIAAVGGFRLSQTEAIGFLWPLPFAALWSLAFLISVPRRAMALGALCVALGAYPIFDRLSADIVYRRTKQMKWILWLNASRLPVPDEEFPMVPRQTRSGLTVYEAPFSKYDSPLPTTPYFNRYLELRRPPDLAGGFRNTNPQPYPLFGYKPGFGMSIPDE